MNAVEGERGHLSRSDNATRKQLVSLYPASNWARDWHSDSELAADWPLGLCMQFCSQVGLRRV